MKLTNTRLAWIFIALAVGAGACSSPASKVILKEARPVSAQTYYVAAEQFKTAQFAPPPAPDSYEQKEDLAAVLAWQNKRTEDDCAKANATANFTYDSLWGARSPFPQPLPAGVKKFFDRLASDLESAVTAMKDRYRRPRPFKAYPEQARPCVKKSWGYSYPSGHAAFSRVFACVLTDIVPGRRDEFFAKSDEIARDRVVGGVHFPTDIAAGKIFGDQFHAALLGSPEYGKDLEKIRALLVK